MKEQEQQFNLGLRTSIYNNELRTRRIKKGLSQYQLAEAVGIPGSYMSSIETFKFYPKYDKLEEIAIYLDTTVEILFPEWLREQRLKVAHFDQSIMVDRISLEAPEVKMLAEPDSQVDLVESELLHNSLMDYLSALTYREQKILKLRFGLEGDSVMTLEQVAQEFSVTRERIRHIEGKALAKLRKHRDADKMADFYDTRIGDNIRAKNHTLLKPKD